jgi:hypothetical protein
LGFWDKGFWAVGSGSGFKCRVHAFRITQFRNEGVGIRAKGSGVMLLGFRFGVDGLA